MMNPDFLKWFFVWMILCIALFIGIGFFFKIDTILRILLTTNFVTFTLVLLDKIAASSRMRRIPESMLFVATFFGGSIGMLFGISLIRHKSRKISFQFMVGLLVLLQVVGIFWYLNDYSFDFNSGVI